VEYITSRKQTKSLEDGNIPRKDGNPSASKRPERSGGENSSSAISSRALMEEERRCFINRITMSTAVPTAIVLVTYCTLYATE